MPSDSNAPDESYHSTGAEKQTAADRISAALEQVLDEKITARIDGRRRTISRAEVIARNLVKKSAAGDRSATAECVRLLDRRTERDATSPPGATFVIEHTLRKFDRALIALGVLERTEDGDYRLNETAVNILMRHLRLSLDDAQRSIVDAALRQGRSAHADR